MTKRIAYIEEILGYKILERSSYGVHLNQAGLEAVETCKSITNKLKELVRQKQKAKMQLRFCSRSYLTQYFVDHFHKDLSQKLKVDFDYMDQSPALTERAARANLLDICLSFGDILLGNNWQTKPIGTVTWSYYARTGHPIFQLEQLKKKSSNDPINYELLGFCYLSETRQVAQADKNLQNLSAKIGSNAQNTKYYISIIQQSNAIGYLPDISIPDDMRGKKIKSIPSYAHLSETKELFAHFNIDTVLAKHKREVLRQLTKKV